MPKLGTGLAGKLGLKRREDPALYAAYWRRNDPERYREYRRKWWKERGKELRRIAKLKHIQPLPPPTP